MNCALKPICSEDSSSKSRYDRRRRRKLRSSLKSMESLNRQEIECRLEDCCMSSTKRIRGTRDVTPLDVAAVPTKETMCLDAGELNQADTLASESSAGDQSYKDDERLIGKSEEEEEDDDDDDDDDSARSVPCVSNGWISVIGRRRVMEDAVAVAEFDSYNFFGVYDGHGGSGVANECRDRLHQMVEARIRSCGGGGGTVDWDKVMRNCFNKMDEEVGSGLAIGEDSDRAVSTMGSTAVVVIVGKEMIVVANCGDSRAVLCRTDACMPLSRDHKVTKSQALT